MNWKEFKDHIESEGVTDDVYIGRISLLSERLDKCSPMVQIFTVGVNKITVIN